MNITRRLATKRPAATRRRAVWPLFGGALLILGGCAQSPDNQFGIGLGASVAALRSAPGKPGIDPDADPVMNDPASVQPLPIPPGAAGSRDRDSDADGVADAVDVCPRSAAGFPVLDNGCALLDGVLSGVRFASGTADFVPGAQKQLDYFTVLLTEYPQARIELIAHTDDSGTVRDQSILARTRLRALGTYLVYRKGILSNRLVLRTFGGTRPIHDNATEAGRRRNNRIEVLENTS